MTSTQPRGTRLKAAAKAARASWLLFLRPGAVLEATWADESRQFIEGAELAKCAGSYAAAFRAAAFRPTLLEALALLAYALGVRRHASQALVIAKPLYDALGGHRDVEDSEHDLMRRLGRRRLVLLRTCAMIESK